MTPAERRLEQAIQQLERYVAIERQFATGSAVDRVVTENGDYPTLAGIADRGDRSQVLLETAQAALDAADDLRSDAAQSAAAAAGALADARAARDEANASASRVSASLGIIEYHHGQVLLLAGERY